ncbi:MULTISPECIES: erythromycin resistance leader peptide [Lysinibacillus]
MIHAMRLRFPMLNQ